MVRYVFEHVVLPDIVFHNPDRIARLFDADSSVRRRELQALLSAVRLRCLDHRLLSEDELEPLMRPYGDGGGDTITCGTCRIEKHVIHTMVMPPPKIAPDAYMVAMTQAADGQIVPGRYFTLELTLTPGRTTMVGRSADGSRSDTDFGPVSGVENFVSAVACQLR